MSMLPTKLQALKLHFFLKDEAGRKNWTVTPGEITCKVAKVIKHTGVQDCLLILRIKLPNFWRTIRTSTSIRIWSTRNLWRTEINLKRISQKCWIRRSFSQMNKLLADEALTTLSHHLWYLAPNNTLFSLAGKKLEDRMMKSAALQTSFICQNQTKSSLDIWTLWSCLPEYLPLSHIWDLEYSHVRATKTWEYSHMCNHYIHICAYYLTHVNIFSHMRIDVDVIINISISQNQLNFLKFWFQFLN